MRIECKAQSYVRTLIVHPSCHIAQSYIRIECEAQSYMRSLIVHPSCVAQSYIYA
jgi:hypothetical protein